MERIEAVVQEQEVRSDDPCKKDLDGCEEEVIGVDDVPEKSPVIEQVAVDEQPVVSPMSLGVLSV